MNRTLNVFVDRSTWPTRGTPAFPTNFHNGHAIHNINIPAMLLMIGYLTTPSSSTGISLSEFWAWVRYLAAISSATTDMRLTQSFAELDAHQKTILSDDFGMGVPMLWLNQRMSFDRIVDGRYFMNHFAETLGATQRRTAKRGPNKTPDFVARDTTGIWHVVECKGTQSGHDYSSNQLGERGPPPTGGIAQKQSILFPPGHSGQKLVSALSIGVESGEASHLTIIDPKYDDPFRVTEAQMWLADDTASRGVMSKILRLAGFETAAETTASPLGRFSGKTRRPIRRYEEERIEYVRERNERAREEIAMTEHRSGRFERGFRGRELIIDLPRPVQIGEDFVFRATIKQGVNEDALAEIRERPTIEDPIERKDIRWVNEMGKISAEGNDKVARLSIGNLFRSELILT